MISDGKITAINISNGLASFQTTNGIAIVEFLGDDLIHVGEVYSGNFEKTGNQTFKNKSQSRLTEVNIKSVNCTPEAAEKLMK